MAAPAQPQANPMHAMPPYPDRFYAAARFAAIPGTVEVAPGSENTTPYSDLTCLALYSLYQQAAQGPCTQPKPWAWNIVELAKWQSWKELGNMSPMEAMRLFVRALEEEDPGWWAKAQELEAQAQAAEEEEAKAAKGEPNGTAGPATPKLPGTNGLDPLSISPLPPLVTSLASQLVDSCQAINSWAPVPTTGRKPSARYQHASIVMGDKMIVVGGNTGRFVNDIQALDLSSLAWRKMDLTSTEATSLPTCAGHALAALDERTVLVLGGHQKAGTAPADDMAVLALDLETLTWRTLKTSGATPMARGGHSATRVGSTLWVFGGEDRQRRLLGDLHALDLTTLVWTAVETKGTSPSARSDHCATVYNERYLTLFGGGSHSFCFNDIHVLDLETKEWSEASAFGTLPSPRAGHAGVAVGSCWFVIGGGDNKCGLCDTMVLDLDTLTWNTVTTAQERTPISSEGLTVVPVESPRGTLLLAFGGYNGKYNNELLVLRPDPQLLSSSMTPGQPNFETAGGFKGSSIDLASAGRPGSTPRDAKKSTAAAEGSAEAPPSSSGAPETQAQRVSNEAQGPKGTNASSMQEPSTKVPADGDAAAAAPDASRLLAGEARPDAAGAAPGAATAAAVSGAGGAVPSAPKGTAASPPDPASEQAILELQEQLMEAQEAVARMEKVVLNARATANESAGQARADAWQAIGKANKEVEEMRERVAAAVAARQQAEDELAEGSARVVAAQAACASAQAEAAKLRKDLAEARARMQEMQAELARIGSDVELAKVRRDYGVCKQALAEAEQEVQSVRSLLSAEQARCFKLEVEVAELRQNLSSMGDLQQELHLLRRQKEASEEAAAAASQRAESRGWFG